jgi:hypothetical protein
LIHLEGVLEALVVVQLKVSVSIASFYRRMDIKWRFQGQSIKTSFPAATDEKTITVSLPSPRTVTSHPTMATQETPTFTYRHLALPIPPNPNLSTIATTPASPPCPTCRHLLLPDRNTIRGTSIPIPDFHLTDTFPHFPTLQTSAKAGCTFCALLRNSILTTWGSKSNPMLESGVTPLSEGDDSYDELFATAWDGAVRIHRAQFKFAPFGGSFQGQQKFAWDEVAGSLEQGDGVVVGLEVEFGPEGVPCNEEGEEIVGEVGGVVRFRVWDSVGE